MKILLIITYIIVSLWISGGVIYWIFRAGKWYSPSLYRQAAETFFGILGGLSILLVFSWCIALPVHNATSAEERKREHAAALEVARKSFENTYSNVFELLRERNRKELELRLAYNRRAARMIEEINSNSFSFAESPYTNFPHARLDRLFILDLRCDTDLVLGKLNLYSSVDVA